MSDTETQVVPENGPGWVVMWHPDTPGDSDNPRALAEVTLEAFDTMWKAKGWQIVGSYAESPGGVSDHERLVQRGEAELKQLAADAGVDITGLKSKKAIADALLNAGVTDPGGEA